MRYFTPDHEWLEPDGDGVLVGITAYAQAQLGDIVFVELPAPGRHVAKGDSAAVVESVKIASDIFAPVTGEVTTVNQLVAMDPSLVNREPEGSGWLFRIRLADPSELDGLMDRQTYANAIA